MATPTVTYTFTNGTVIDASQHNTNYNDLISALTDGLKDLDVADIGATTGTITTLNTTTLTIAGITTISSGSVSAPGLAFSGTSSNTGIYLIGTDNMGFAANGVAAGNISSAGLWTIGVSGSTAQHVLNGRYIDIQGSSSGSTGVLITNATNSANAHAAIEFNIGGTSGGDPYLRFNTAQAWGCGVDNSDGDSFKISANATLGTFDYLAISAAGAFTVGATGVSHTWSGRMFLHRDTYSGGDINLYCQNLSNTANSQAMLTLDVAGSSAGNAFIYFAVQGATNWTLGCENASSDRICLSNSTVLGTNPYWTVSTDGAWSIGPSAGGITHRLNTNTQTTVGAAGAASALPANPTGYITININGTDRVIPYYAAS